MLKDIGEVRARSVSCRLKWAGELRLPTNLCDVEGHGRVEGKVCLLQVEVGWRAEVTH
jgi:hypothetical protein